MRRLAGPGEGHLSGFKLEESVRTGVDVEVGGDGVSTTIRLGAGIGVDEATTKQFESLQQKRQCRTSKLDFWGGL